jgi:hypothetical protein
VGYAISLYGTTEGTHDRLLADDLAHTPGSPLAVERRVFHWIETRMGKLTRLV